MSSPEDKCIDIHDLARNTVRVLYVSPGGVEGRGGMGRMARYLAAAFEEIDKNIHCRVVDSWGPGNFWKMPLYFTRVFVLLLVLCVRRKVDVVHLHMSFRGSALRKLILLWLASLFHVGTVLHIHGSEFELWCNSLRPWKRWLLVATLRRASRIIVLGEFWRRFLTDGLQLNPNKVHIVHNGVPLPPPRDRSLNGEPCHILCLGLLGPRKGTPELLKALADPTLAQYSWRATIAGNGAVDMYRHEAQQLKLSERVCLPGWVDADRVASYLNEADIFVLPSHNEGLPVAILEAMAVGLPVITTTVGAIPDLVVEGQTGTMVTPGTVDALAAALVSFVSDPELRARCGALGRERVIAAFSINHTAARIAALYREACH